MSKIFLCGDPHGEFSHILLAIEMYHPDAVLILGDLTPPHSLDDIFKGIQTTAIYWIPGNHDTDSDLIYDRLWRSSYAKHNLHGRVQDICGVNVAGLGGVFRGQIWMPPQEPHYNSPSVFIRKIGRSSMWRGGLPRRHRSTIFNSICDKLKDQKADVLITHEAPSMHPKGFEKIDEIAQSMGVKYVFHAHQHECLNYGNSKGFQARGVGLREIIDLNGNIIVPAQVDPRELEKQKELSCQPEEIPKKKVFPFSKVRHFPKGRFSHPYKKWTESSRNKFHKKESLSPSRHSLRDQTPQKDK